MNILLLCNKPNVGNDANTIVDHIEAFEHHSKHKIWVFSNMGAIPSGLNLEKFDAIIIHYSTYLLNDYYISRKSKTRIREYTGLKVVFIQDEYRKIDLMNAELSYLDIDVLYTCFPESEINNIYAPLQTVSKYNNLTGYIPERLTTTQSQVPMNKRPLHVGYRGRKVPYWLGELAYEKWSIVDKWFEFVGPDALKVDLSYNEKDRIYGQDWTAFLSSCKTTLGVESGASVMDFSGELEKMVDVHQLLYPNETFQEVQQKFLLEHEGKHKLNQISPRCFEAIVLKTVMVLYEGEYSGILIPGRHYIMLKKDFSNIQDVVAILQDDAKLQQIADVAFDEIALNPAYGYKTFIEGVDGVLDAELIARNKSKMRSPYTENKYHDVIKWSVKKQTFKNDMFKSYSRLPAWFRFIIKMVLRPKSGMQSLKTFTSNLYAKITKNNKYA